MINYVIINGVNSNTITGLMINELPPITKPQMRAMQEEIDGRDGDITTNLGYSAYDKTITIGLFGTGYDINNIISFFNGEGTIVFSNEDDKYYNFKILNQIDYVSLQKFKSASITFHCQPFKYPLTETPLEIEYSYIEDEGESLTLNDTGESTLELNLKGNTSQTGTPTPSSPIPVNVVSGDNTITIANSDNSQSQTYPINLPIENLFKDGTTFTPSTVGWYDQNGNLLNGVSDTQSNTNYIDLQANTTYTFSVKEKTNIAQAQCIYVNNNNISLLSDISLTNKTTITPTNNLRVWIRVKNSATAIETLFKGQLEKGSKANSFTPFGQTPLELCKIGDYQDYFTKNSDGQWCKYNAIGKVVLDGSETGWRLFFETSGIFINSSILTSIDSASTTNCKSNYYTGTDRTYIRGNLGTANNVCATNNTELIFANKSLSTASDFKTWLNTHNTTIYYVLATPYLSLIEDNNLIEQLDNLQNAMSYSGTTNINQINNDLPFNINAKALEQGSNEVVVNNIGNAYSKPLIALEGSGNVDIYLDNTQILKANVEDKMNIDIAKLEAYNPDTSALLNRQVIGNYNTMTLQPGNNTIRIDGALDKATISNYTRWL